MTMLDQTDHNRLAELANARLRAPQIADRYILRTDNRPPEPVADLDQLERDAILAEAAGPDDDELIRQVPVDPDRELKGAREAYGELNVFMIDNPVIQTPAAAKLLADFVIRSRIALQQLDKERVGKVKPFNDKVDEINAEYNKKTKNPFKLLYDLACKRLDEYRKTEEKKRQVAAALIAAAAAEAARLAEAAKVAVVEAVDDAAQGAETDVGSMIVQAEAAMADARKLARQSTIADRDAVVRIPSSMGRTVAARTYKDLLVADLDAAILAIRSMGLTEALEEAICTEARKFKATWGELPEGVTENSERRI